MLDLHAFQQRDLGRWLPKAYEARREAGQMGEAEKRAALCADALWFALRHRDVLGRKLYAGDGISLDDWPSLQPLTPTERTAVIRELRRILDVPEKAK